VIIPPKTAVPRTRRLAAPAPRAITTGGHAEDEGEGGHEDWPEAQAGRFDRGVRQAPTGGTLRAGKLHDEDRVLARERHEQDDGDQRVDVVVHAAERDGDHGPEERERHHQHHRRRVARYGATGGGVVDAVRTRSERIPL